MRRRTALPFLSPPDSRRLRIALRYFDLGGDKAKRAGANVASSATCNPISEPDLAMEIVDCVADRAKSSAGGDPIWNVGGPDAGLSMRDQGELLAKIVEKEPKLLAVPTARARRGRGVKAQALALPLLQVPIGLFDVIINGIQWLADLRAREGFGFIPEGVAQQLEDAAELGRIGEAPRSSPRASPSSPSLSKRRRELSAPSPPCPSLCARSYSYGVRQVLRGRGHAHDRPRREVRQHDARGARRG